MTFGLVRVFREVSPKEADAVQAAPHHANRHPNCPSCHQKLDAQDTHHVPGSRKRTGGLRPEGESDASWTSYITNLDHSVAAPWIYCKSGHGYMRYRLPSGAVFRLMRRTRPRIPTIQFEGLLEALSPFNVSAHKLDQVKRVLQTQVQGGYLADEPQELLKAAKKLLGLLSADS